MCHHSIQSTELKHPSSENCIKSLNYLKLIKSQLCHLKISGGICNLLINYGRSVQCTDVPPIFNEDYNLSKYFYLAKKYIFFTLKLKKRMYPSKVSQGTTTYNKFYHIYNVNEDSYP